MIDLDGSQVNPEDTGIESSCGNFENNGTVQDIAFALYKYKFWIMLSAIVSIIIGILLCLSLVGIVIGWLPIWLGTILKSSLRSFEAAYEDGDTFELDQGIMELNKYFRINGILQLIFLIITVISLLSLASLELAI